MPATMPPPQMYCRAEQAKRNRLMAQKLMREAAAIERDRGSQRFALATSPGSPTPQHHFPDPQKLVSRFQSQFSRTGPKTVLRARRPLVGFGSYFNTFRRIHTYRSGIASSTCGRDQYIFEGLKILATHPQRQSHSVRQSGSSCGDSSRGRTTPGTEF